jgi:hypothetical protein
MDATDWRGRVRRCRVAWDAGASEVGVWAPNGEGPDWAWQRVDVIEAFTVGTVDQVRDEAPGAGMALDAVEVLRDPQTAISLTIAALVEVAMVHAGVPPTAAKLIGDVAGRLGRRLLAADSGGDRGPGVPYADFDYDPGTGRTWPEKPQIGRAERGSPPDAPGDLPDPRRHDSGSTGSRSWPADCPWRQVEEDEP